MIFSDSIFPHQLNTTTSVFVSTSRVAESYSQPFRYDVGAYYASGSYSLSKYNTANKYCPDLTFRKDIYLDANQDYSASFATRGISGLAGGVLTASVMRYYSTTTFETFAVTNLTDSQFNLALTRTQINNLLLDNYVYEVKCASSDFQYTLQAGRILIKR